MPCLPQRSNRNSNSTEERGTTRPSSKCVITGHDVKLNAVPLESRPIGERLVRGKFGNAVSIVWSSEHVPAPICLSDGVLSTNVHGPFTNNSATMMLVEFAPESDVVRNLSASAAREHFRATMGDVSTYKPGAAHPLMHRTETIDFGVVLSGEVYLIMDHEEILLRQGDVFVQNGTNHAWSNRSDKPCRLALSIVAGRFEPQLANQFNRE
jgi:quercetin dioxygenase-like cupin family protein